AIRQFRLDVGRENSIFIHVTWVPYLKTAGEVKTKPTQHSVKELRAIGIQPDILLCRTETTLTKELKDKISLFCNVPTDAVITAQDVKSIYEVPLCFHKEGLDGKILELLNIWTGAPRIEPWQDLMRKINHPKHTVLIAIIGKYVDLRESYKSLHEALVHGGVANDAKVELRYVNAEDLESQDADKLLAGCHGILVPGGFGKRGVKGKMRAITYARENKIPFFGICLGMQLAVVEFAQNVAGIADADSNEFANETKHPVIYLMKEWFDPRTNQTQVRDETSEMGGTLRLGSYPCQLAKNTFAHAAYQEQNIDERHRHRYEFNNAFRDELVEKGLIISGASPDNT
ncbi:MAG: CTP synthase, partial [Desulfobulbaceae bacterium]|nr:CTP synthase [Desulfobulbaceae bacterium]